VIEVFSDTDASIKIPRLVALEMKEKHLLKIEGFLGSKRGTGVCQGGEVQ
jgi:hypothetical protein